MLTIDEAFAKFKSRLEITATERDQASQRQRTLRSQVQAEMAVERDFLTGSYARHTKAKPLKDVDVFLVFGEEEHEYVDRPPKIIIERLRRILEKHYATHRLVEERHSVRVDFGVKVVDDVSDDVMSIDAVPAFSVGDHFIIPDVFTGGWTHTDPQVHASQATHANQSLEQHWKPAVKMAKKWNDHQGRPIKPSFLLEVMALKLLKAPWGSSYPYELRQFFASSANRVAEVWNDPAGLGPPVSDRVQSSPQLLSEARTAFGDAEARCTSALRLAREGKTGAALAEWQELFGPLFSKS